MIFDNYTVEFVLSLKDKYIINDDTNIPQSLNDFMILYDKQSDKVDFKIPLRKNKNYIKSNNTEKNKYINKNIRRVDNRHGNSRGKNRDKSNNHSEWRKNIELLSKSENAWCSHSRNNDNTKDIDLLSTYKKIIICNLNKTTNKNIDKIIGIMSEKLLEYTDVIIMYILAEELLKKIWFDNSYYSQYVKIYNHFCNIKEWQENLYVIYNDNSGKYYWKYIKYGDEYEAYTPMIFGPFTDSIEANIDALNKTSFKYIFLNHCQKEFQNRQTYVDKINYYYNLKIDARETLEKNENIDVDSEIYKLKRKIFGTTEIIGFLTKHKKINKDIVNIIFSKIIEELLNDNINDIFYFLSNDLDIDKDNDKEIITLNFDDSNNINDEQRKKSLLLQCLFEVWYIIDKKQNTKSIRRHTNTFNNDIAKEYIYLITYITEKNKWKTQTKFIIEDFYNFINKRYKQIKTNKIKTIIQNKIKQYKNIINGERDNDENDTVNEYIFDEENFNSFRSSIDGNISSYFKKQNYKSFVDNLDNIVPGDISTIGEDIYNKYMDELIFTAFVRCFEYNNEEDCLINGLVSSLLKDKFISNKNIENTYELINQYWDDFIIDFPLMEKHMKNIKEKITIIQENID